MDKRFKNVDIFNRRSQEWNLDKISSHIEEIFKSIDNLDFWEFDKVEWVIEKSKKKEELKKSIFKTLKVNIKELTKKKEVKKEHEYKIQIPELINNQFFYVGGLLKVPIFQLYDDPIIYRVTSRGIILKFKNNALSVITTINRKNKCLVSIYNNHMNLQKNIPIEKVITALYTKEQFEEWYNKYEIAEDSILSIMKDDCDEIWNINSDKLNRGKSIVFSLKRAFDVDIFTKNYMHTNCVILELLHAIYNGPKSDTDLDRKRIRFEEYILADLIKTVYDMVCTLYYSNKIKFKITQSILMDVCNVSDIVHYNFPVNPVAEIASLLQCSVTGPGGFKKESVPAHLKNLDDTQVGKICPADTPDRDGCGVILNLVPAVSLDVKGKFIDRSPIVCSYPITLTPFMKNDDQTRLQMASNQMKQSLLLENPSPPMIKTGAESNFLNFTSFQYVAKEAGIVLHRDNEFIVVVYDDGTVDSCKLGYRNVCSNFADKISTSLREGTKFKKNHVLCESSFIKNKDITLGQNLLTGVCIYEGYNYEDGIVISEEVVDKFTSVHVIDLSFEIESGQVLLSLDDDFYKPLPQIGDTVKRGSVFAKIKHINGEDGFESINIDPSELAAPDDCIITNIELYPNTWNKQIPQFDYFVKSYMDKQNDRIQVLRDKLSTHMSKQEIDKFFTLNEMSHLESEEKVGCYAEKGNKINGVFVKIQAVYKECIGVGDKIANRHGNKGVISKIIPKDKMPKLDDGRYLDVIINPLGIISRMNSGQLFELHMSEALYQLKNKIKDIYKSEKTPVSKLIVPLEEFLEIIDKSDNKWVTKETLDRFEKDCRKGKLEAIENIQIIEPPFQSTDPDSLFKVMKTVDANFKEQLYNPISGKYFNNPIAIGYLYFLKLVHRASDKMIGRSIGPYNRNTLQPVGGKKKLGGHRLGEMEVWSFLAHGANESLKELLTTHSDSPGKKNKLLSGILQNPDLSAMDNSDDRPQSYRLLEASLKVLGIELTE